MEPALRRILFDKKESYLIRMFHMYISQCVCVLSGSVGRMSNTHRVFQNAKFAKYYASCLDEYTHYDKIYFFFLNIFF